MKVSDYIVEYLIKQGITDVFGYPGGMVTHLMDSLGKYEKQIKTHITYHEQGAAFAACGYAQASDKVGIAFATSGPGATNLLTGICNAYFDSVPTVFITGQVNTFESKGDMRIRQKGFQETDIVSMAAPVTKEAIYVSDAADIRKVLERAFTIAAQDRKGPVLLDIPMNVFRAEVDQRTLTGCGAETDIADSSTAGEGAAYKESLEQAFRQAKRPCLLLGNGIKIDHQIEQIRELVRKCPIPVVSSMLAVDIIPEDSGLEGTYYGFVGAYGNRTANFVAAKSDLLITLGSRLDVRQVGGKRENFAPQAQIIRVDIDEFELENRIRTDEQQFKLPLSEAIPILDQVLCNKSHYEGWLSVCQEIKRRIKYTDEKEPNRFINAISRNVPDGYGVAADVGQNQVWVAQSFRMKKGQRLYMSGGHGAMGYALPAAIGIYYATHRPVICFSGDGGFQMNIQELQFIVRENLPIKMIVVNNMSLGMIRHFQEMYFQSNYYYTIAKEGYTVPDFVRIAKAYGIQAKRIMSLDEIAGMTFDSMQPELFEVLLSDDTVVAPKLEFGKPNQDQEPLLDRGLYQYLMEL